MDVTVAPQSQLLVNQMQSQNSAGISSPANASLVSDDSSVMSVSPNPGDDSLESRLNTTISEPDDTCLQDRDLVHDHTDSYSSSLATNSDHFSLSSLGQYWPMSISPDYSQSPQFKRQLLNTENMSTSGNNPVSSGDSFYKTTASLKLPTFAHTMTRTP